MCNDCTLTALVFCFGILCRRLISQRIEQRTMGQDEGTRQEEDTG